MTLDVNGVKPATKTPPRGGSPRFAFCQNSGIILSLSQHGAELVSCPFRRGLSLVIPDIEKNVAAQTSGGRVLDTVTPYRRTYHSQTICLGSGNIVLQPLFQSLSLQLMRAQPNRCLICQPLDLRLDLCGNEGGPTRGANTVRGLSINQPLGRLVDAYVSNYSTLTAPESLGAA